MQIFSRDNILQLILYMMISLFLEYSINKIIDEWLKSLISTLEMIFLNISLDYIDSSDLRKLSKIFVNRVKFMFNDLINNHDIIHNIHENSSFSFHEWEEIRNFYDHSFIHYRSYYEEWDNNKQIDAIEFDKCKKYYSIYDQ